MFKSILSPGVVSSLVKVREARREWRGTEQNFTFKSDHLVHCACWHVVVQSNRVSASSVEL